MTTSRKPPYGSPEPEQAASEIDSSPMLRPERPPAEQAGGNPALHPVRPVLGGNAASPALPPPENNGKLNLRSFSVHGVEHLPTAAVPTPNEQQQSYAGRVPAAVSSAPGEMQASRHNQEHIPAQPAHPQQFSHVRNINSEPTIQNGPAILYQSSNFYVRTTNRRGPRPNPLRLRTGHTTHLPKVAPGQEQRISASETRVMPNITLANPTQTKLAIPVWLEAFLITIGLLGALIAHIFNLAYFPTYELDEGTYMSSAWAILHGMLMPYPYGYGHPPAGWIQIALWAQLTGGLFTFGNAITSGRVLMVLYALGSALLVYLATRRLTGSRASAMLAMIIFSLSPLSIIYQRQVFLDNIGTFWLVLALYLIISCNSRLLFIILSGVSFGLAMLSKEIFVIFIPVMVYAVWIHTTKFQRKFALVAFAYTVISFGSTFVLMAILKGELLPTGVLPWDHHPHLSMFDTFSQQAQRGQDEGSLGNSWIAWTSNDFPMVAFSIIPTLFNLLIGWWKRKQLLLALCAVTFWILLIRGGVVFGFYFIPMIPLAAFNAATAIHYVLRYLSKLIRLDAVRLVLLALVLASIIFFDVKQALTYSTERPATAEINALLWIRNYIPQNSFLVINSYFYTDLHEPGGEGTGNGVIYPYANIYWNVAYDPELHDQLLQNNWDRIDYIITDDLMLRDITTRGEQMSIITDALNHSVLRAEFQSKSGEQTIDIRVYQVVHKLNPQVIGLTSSIHQADYPLSPAWLSLAGSLFPISNRKNT